MRKQTDGSLVGWILTDSEGNKASSMTAYSFGLPQEQLDRARNGEKVQTERGMLTYVKPEPVWGPRARE